MKAFIIITCLSFPYLFQIEPTKNTNQDSSSCDVTFYSHVNQGSKEIPFTYNSDCKLSYLEVEVFNQWGEHIHKIDELDFQWFGKKIMIDEDGNEEETSLPEGTYYYTAKYKFEGEEKLQKEGGTIQLEL